jgi:hypothetical protein
MVYAPLMEFSKKKKDLFLLSINVKLIYSGAYPFSI